MTDLPGEISVRLALSGLDPDEVARVIRIAFAEDLSHGPDVTTQSTIPAVLTGTADVVARVPGVVAGLSVAEAAFAMAGMSDGAVAAHPVAATRAVPGVSARRWVSDGERVTAGSMLMTVQGPLRAILTAERTALNLLTHMSGVASLTRQWADAVTGTRARVRDTRKTLPGLRTLEKYSVRCGGGANHRMSLGDAALIKDNHIAAAGSVRAAYEAVRKLAPDMAVEVECDTLGQVAEAIEAGAELILLDNFGLDQMREAVRLTGGRALLEASGGLRLDNAAQVAATGVDFLAVGALTHSAPALDIGLDLAEAG